MITIDFDFHQQSAQDLKHLNNLLFFLDLDNVKFQHLEGYLATTTDGKGNLLGRRYGLNKGRMICTETPEGPGKQFQITTCVADSSIPPKEYLDTWRQEHPDEIMYYSRAIGFDEEDEDVIAYTILHHQKEIPGLSW